MSPLKTTRVTIQLSEAESILTDRLRDDGVIEASEKVEILRWDSGVEITLAVVEGEDDD